MRAHRSSSCRSNWYCSPGAPSFSCVCFTRVPHYHVSGSRRRSRARARQQTRWPPQASTARTTVHGRLIVEVTFGPPRRRSHACSPPRADLPLGAEPDRAHAGRSVPQAHARRSEADVTVRRMIGIGALARRGAAPLLTQQLHAQPRLPSGSHLGTFDRISGSFVGPPIAEGVRVHGGKR